MMKQELRNRLHGVRKLATTSKLGRLASRPRQYVYALGLRDLFGGKEKEVNCVPFFGLPMQIILPAATDIYITKGKSHPSEIRLARFLIERLEVGDTFLDIGSHYGYFSLLASVLVGEKGAVHCFEAAPSTFLILQKNIKDVRNIIAVNQAASDTGGHLTFYEFPTMYSEYNSMDIEQYEGQDWLKQYPPKAVEVPASPLEVYIAKEGIQPKIIKIDVEGAELKVLQGAQKTLVENSPLIAMEYIRSDRAESPHRQASLFLDKLEYFPHAINEEGELVQIKSIEKYMSEAKLDSDNIVFVKDA